jgi:hypothetical protein
LVWSAAPTCFNKQETNRLASIQNIDWGEKGWGKGGVTGSQKHDENGKTRHHTITEFRMH